jgi:hypothetical protein
LIIVWRIILWSSSLCNSQDPFMSQKRLPVDETFKWISHRRKVNELQFSSLLYAYTSQNNHETERVWLHTYLGRRYKKYLEKSVRETMITS